MRILLSYPAPDAELETHVTSLAIGLTLRGHDVIVHSAHPMDHLLEAYSVRIIRSPSLAELILDGDFDVAHLTSDDDQRVGPWTYKACPAPLVLTVFRERKKLRAVGLSRVIFSSDELLQRVRLVGAHPKASVLPLVRSPDDSGAIALHVTTYEDLAGRRPDGPRRWLATQLSGDRYRRRSAQMDPRRSDNPIERIGVLVTSYCRPDSLQRCVSGVAGLTGVSAVCVVDNSPDPVRIQESADFGDHVRVEVIADGTNRGQSAAVSIGLHRLQDADAVLILDDDTVPTNELLTDLKAAMEPGVAGVGLENQHCFRYNGAGPPRLLAWSPSLIRMEAVREIGPPESLLFFGADDFDFSLRLIRVGWGLKWLPHQLSVLRTGTFWPERQYFDARNSVWLATWRRSRTLPMWLLAGDMIWMLGAEARSLIMHPSDRVIRRAFRAILVGLVHGLVGRMGAPPPWILSGRGSPNEPPFESILL